MILSCQVIPLVPALTPQIICRIVFCNDINLKPQKHAEARSSSEKSSQAFWLLLPQSVSEVNWVAILLDSQRYE